MQLNMLTLIVPTKNETANINRFLDSVPDGLRTIIVDASSDDTGEIIRNRSQSSIEMIQDDGNIATARQLAAEQADTEWLLYSDADVFFAEDYFDVLQEMRFDNDQGAVVGAKLSRGRYRHYYRLFSLGQRFLCSFNFPSGSGSNMIVRRQALFDAGGFDCTFSCNEDTDLVWRIFKKCYSINYEGRLKVYEFDHRRLDRGVFRKTIHSLARCILILSGWRAPLMNRDWGYWDTKTTTKDSFSSVTIARS